MLEIQRENMEIQNKKVETENKEELLRCEKCKNLDKIIINFDACNHLICMNCIYKYFLSSGFKGLDLEGVKAICPLCKKGEKDLSLEDFSEFLNNCVYSKKEINANKDDNYLYDSEINNTNFCKTHKDKKLIKYCNDCKYGFCEMCISELHERNFPNHELIDIQQEKDINIIKNKNNADGNSKANVINELIENQEELKSLSDIRNVFLQKLENEKKQFNEYIVSLIDDLNAIKDNYTQKYISFETSMKKIFEIIQVTYLKYHTSSPEEKNQILITKDLLDINFISKKIDFNEMRNQLKRTLNEVRYNNNFFSYELQWSSFEYKKSFELNSKDKNEVEDCVTKIIELQELNKIVAGLIGGQIYVWNLDERNIEKEVDAHKSAIWALIKLSNNMIASGSSDKTIKIWNIDNFEKPIILKGHNGTIFCLAELEKYKIISGSEDRTIKIWDILEKRKCIQTIRSDSKINCLHILPDPGFIITGGDDNLIKIWNIYSELVTDILEGHECTIWSITGLTSDSSIIASGSSDNTIIVWDLQNLKRIFSLEGHENTISCLKMMKNGLLLSCSWDTTIKIWNLKTRSCITSLKGHKNIVWDAIELNDGDIASCSSDNKIIVWKKKSD